MDSCGKNRKPDGKIHVQNAITWWWSRSYDFGERENADTVIIDDANAKKHAKYLKLSVTGTLGVLIKAKRQGYISELKPIIQEMVDKNIYISEKLMKLCLEQVDEEM